MPKVKKENTELKRHSFVVDMNDPKYKELVEYLDNIEAGAKSFVIRQLLMAAIQLGKRG